MTFDVRESLFVYMIKWLVAMVVRPEIDIPGEKVGVAAI